jgi:hypothetical protein
MIVLEDKLLLFVYKLLVIIHRSIIMSHFFAVGARKFLAFLGAFFAFALLAACSSQTPESVASDYMKAVANNRVDEAIGYFALEDVKENDLTAVKGKMQMVVGSQYSKIQERGGMKSVSSTLIEQKDGTAVVEVEITYKNDETRKDRMPLIKESGKWKIKLK